VRSRGSLIRLTAAAALAVIGFALALATVRTHYETDKAREALVGIPASVRAETRQTRKLAGENRELRRQLATINARVRELSSLRASIRKAARAAGMKSAEHRAYVRAYKAGFPVALSSGVSWYVIHTKSGSATETWTAFEGHEYVVADGKVAEYAAGAAPDPYALPDLAAPSSPTLDLDAPSLAAPSSPNLDLLGSGSGSSGFDSAADGCPAGSYANVDGNCIPGPSSDPNLDVPGGPTAVCADGTYSYSQHRSGTCSHHGGVSSWNP
jgi:hypothetical protein